MDINNSWFDAQAFEDCAAEQGTPMALCRKEVISQGNPEYGVKPQTGFKCRSVKGHIDRKRSLISTGAGSVVAEQIFAYILPNGFSPEEVGKDSYLQIGSTYYQMELVDTVQSRGTVLQYKYKLDKTDGTVSR